MAKYNSLLKQAKLLGEIRTEVWHRFGSIGGVGLNHRDIRTDWVKNRDFSPLPAKAWKETLRDALDDIKLYEASAKERVRKQINSRFKIAEDRKKYFSLLKSNQWRENAILSRWMRKTKKHGKNHVHNQIIIENGVYSQFAGKDGNTWLKIPSLVRNKRIAIPLNSNVKLKGMLRLILRAGIVEVHYLAKNKKNKVCGNQIIGIDKGYSEVFADSDGELHGIGFNKMLTEASEKRMRKNKYRNKLWQIAKKANNAKKTRMIKNNLGTHKRTKENRKIKQQIRTLCFSAAHKVVDKASLVIAEDLTSPIARRSNIKKYNRLMNQWMKGAITESLETVTKARGSGLHYVNAAYTSQMDSKTHRLEGLRVGDKFHHGDGVVGHADINAARNIKHRYFDKEITRYMPYQKVKSILLNRLRASEELSDHQRPSLQDSSYAPEMDINRERFNLEIDSI